MCISDIYMCVIVHLHVCVRFHTLHVRSLGSPPLTKIRVNHLATLFAFVVFLRTLGIVFNSFLFLFAWAGDLYLLGLVFVWGGYPEAMDQCAKKEFINMEHVYTQGLLAHVPLYSVFRSSMLRNDR